MNNIYLKPYTFIKDNYFSTGGYTSVGGISYLDKNPRESIEFYAYRRNRAYLNNIFKNIIDLYLNPIFSAKKDITTNNVNLNNVINESKILENSYKILLDYQLYDKCYYVIETINNRTYPEIYSIFPEYIEEVYLNSYSIDRMTYYIYENVNDMQFKIQCVYNSASNSISKTTLMWTNENNEIVNTNLGDENRINIFDGISTAVIYKEGISNIKDLPKSFSLATLQKNIFNKESERDNILNASAFPVLAIQTDADIQELSLSENSIIKVPTNITNMPEYLEPSGSSIELYEKIILNLYSSAYKLYSSNLLADNVRYTTATSAAIASNSFYNSVNVIYNVYKNILKNILDSIIDIYDLSTTYDIEFEDINILVDNTQIDTINNDLNNNLDNNLNK